MVGLRTCEGDKFERFFEIVQREATKKGCVYFLDSSEGHIYENEVIDCEDLSGWLVPNEKVEKFEKLYLQWSNMPGWDEFYCWAEWEDEENPKISFVWYD